MIDALLVIVAVYLTGTYLLGMYLFARMLIGKHLRMAFPEAPSEELFSFLEAGSPEAQAHHFAAHDGDAQRAAA